MPNTTDQTDGKALVDPASSPADRPDPVSDPTRQRDRASARRRLLVWLAVGAGALVLAVIVVLSLVLVGGKDGPIAGPGGASGSPARKPLVLPLTRIVPISVTGHAGGPVVTRTAQAIKTILSRFYDQAFVDPANWQGGPPASAWSLFAPSIRDRAQRDVAALTIGRTGPRLARLDITDSFVTVRELLDPAKHVTSAQATVELKANGTLSAGGSVRVVATATFLLANQDGHWVITGYPRATVSVTPLASAPSAGPSAGPSAAPSGGATP